MIAAPVLALIQYPQIDPVLIAIGPIAIRWYALAYIGSLLLAWRILRRLVRLDPPVATQLQVDDFLTWATLGVVIGGRLGYVLFYRPGDYLADPLSALMVWKGGMSFHGGALGVMVAIIVYCRRYGIPVVGFADRLVVVAPIGLFLGRLANFINGELWGRVADVPWAMVFPGAGPLPRHPSQLYQAGMEGLVLGLVLAVLCARRGVRARFGVLSGVFLIGYGVARGVGELFRQPDAFLGFLFAGATMGQLLSIPMVLGGLALILTSRPRPGFPAA